MNINVSKREYDGKFIIWARNTFEDFSAMDWYIVDVLDSIKGTEYESYYQTDRKS